MVVFTGLSSVWDRTVFTDRGPLVKRPLSILTGTNLRIISDTAVEIPTGSFTSSYDGYLLVISGSDNYRNDGTFVIDEVLSTTQLRLKNVNFDISDPVSTSNAVIALANNIRDNYNDHLLQSGVHGTNDTINTASSTVALTLSAAII